MSKEFPHDKVFTRIRQSEKHGVGIFAIMDIPKDTPLFYGDENTPTIEVQEDEIQHLPLNIKQLYIDFCPLNKGIFTCPVNFNLLTVSWYLNRPDNASDIPNAICKEGLIFYTSRDVKEGEELIADYDTYSE